MAERKSKARKTDVLTIKLEVDTSAFVAEMDRLTARVSALRSEMATVAVDAIRQAKKTRAI